MSLRNLASSVAFCCARAPTKVSNAPAIASATYSSQRHRSAFLCTALLIVAVIPYFLAARGPEFARDVPTCAAYAIAISALLQALLFSWFGPAGLRLPMSRAGYARLKALLDERK